MRFDHDCLQQQDGGREVDLQNKPQYLCRQNEHVNEQQ